MYQSILQNDIHIILLTGMRKKVNKKKSVLIKQFFLKLKQRKKNSGLLVLGKLVGHSVRDIWKK